MDYDPLDVRYYTVAEVAKMLRVSKMTAYRFIERYGLHAIRVGDSFRIPEPALRAWLGDTNGHGSGTQPHA